MAHRYQKVRTQDGLYIYAPVQQKAAGEYEDTAQRNEGLADGRYYDANKALPRELDFATAGTFALVDPETGFLRRGPIPLSPAIVVQRLRDGRCAVTSTSPSGKRVVEVVEDYRYTPEGNGYQVKKSG